MDDEEREYTEGDEFNFIEEIEQPNNEEVEEILYYINLQQLFLFRE